MRTFTLLSIGLLACSRFGDSASADPSPPDAAAGDGGNDAASPPGGIMLESSDIVLTRGAEVLHDVRVVRTDARGPVTVRLDGAPPGVTADEAVAEREGLLQLRLRASSDAQLVRGVVVRVVASAGDSRGEATASLTVRDVAGALDTSYGDAGIAQTPGLVPDRMCGTAHYLVRDGNTWFVHGSSVYRPGGSASPELRRGVFAFTATGTIATEYFGGGGGMALPRTDTMVNEWIEARAFVKDGKLHFTASEAFGIYSETVSLPAGVRQLQPVQSAASGISFLVRDQTYVWGNSLELTRLTWDGVRADPWGSSRRAFPVNGTSGFHSGVGIGVASSFVAQAAGLQLEDGSHVTRVWVVPHDAEAHHVDLPQTTASAPTMASAADAQGRLTLLNRDAGQACFWRIEKDAAPSRFGECSTGQFTKMTVLHDGRIVLVERNDTVTSLHLFDADGARAALWPAAGVPLPGVDEIADLVDDGEGGLLVLSAVQCPWQVRRVFL